MGCGGSHSLAVDDMWDLFESLTWHQWKSDDARDPYHHYLLTLTCCALFVNLLTMMCIHVPIMISLMSVMLDLVP